MAAAPFLALLVIVMLMLSGLRLELNYRRGVKVGAGPARPLDQAAPRPPAARPALRRVPDPYTD
jgi:hypothetical protein